MRNFRISTMLLKIGTEYDLTIYDIAYLFIFTLLAVYFIEKSQINYLLWNKASEKQKNILRTNFIQFS